MHDGPPPYVCLAVWEFLNNVFLEQWIGQGDPTVCPTHSPDLNPLDFYLWGHLKSCLCYRSQWCLGLATMNTEWIWDDLHNTWNFPLSLAITVQMCDVKVDILCILLNHQEAVSQKLASEGLCSCIIFFLYCRVASPLVGLAMHFSFSLFIILLFAVFFCWKRSYLFLITVYWDVMMCGLIARYSHFNLHELAARMKDERNIWLKEDEWVCVSECNSIQLADIILIFQSKFRLYPLYYWMFVLLSVLQQLIVSLPVLPFMNTHIKTPLEFHFMYLDNKEVYYIWKMCCIF
jgi:hypothetical protein